MIQQIFFECLLRYWSCKWLDRPISASQHPLPLGSGFAALMFLPRAKWWSQETMWDTWSYCTQMASRWVLCGPFPSPNPPFGSVSPPEPDFSLQLWNLRLHKKKVAHVALNPCCDWLLATASVDQTVKIWDLRQIKSKTSFLYSLPHRHAVNAGVTSQTSSFLWTLSLSY